MVLSKTCLPISNQLLHCRNDNIRIQQTIPPSNTTTTLKCINQILWSHPQLGQVKLVGVVLIICHAISISLLRDWNASKLFLIIFIGASD